MQPKLQKWASVSWCVPNMPLMAILSVSRGFVVCKQASYQGSSVPRWNFLKPRYLMTIPDGQVAKDKLKLLWLSCGNKDGLIRISQ